MSRKTTKFETEYQLTVSLKRPKSIRRSLVLRGDQTLHDLHEVIFRAFGRFDEHLYCFYVKPGRPGRLVGAGPGEYSGPPRFVRSEELVDGHFSAARARLDSLGLKVGQRFEWFEYLFDFGDSWWHDVHIDRIGPAAAARDAYPRIVDQRGKSPAQFPR